MVGGNVRGGVDRRKFVLRGSNLVVLRFCQNSEFPQFLVQVSHIFRNAGLDYAEIMVVHFLTFGRFCAEKRSAGKNQVFPLIVHCLIYKEVFLFGSYRCANALNIVIAEKFKDSQCLPVKRFH